MKNQHRLRVSRTTIRALDRADIVVGGGDLFPFGGGTDPQPPTMTCPSVTGEVTGCNGSVGEDCPTRHTRLVTL
jgi:hypothetical protein